MARPSVWFSKLGRHIRGRVLSGLLIILPLAATYLILKFLYDIVNPPLANLLRNTTGQDIPGVGVVTFLIMMYVFGLVGSYVIGRRLIALGHRVADYIPFVRPIYRTARSTVDALGAANWQASQHSRVVLLEYPMRGVKSLGFVTSSYRDPQDRAMVAVYIPTSPVPTSGFLALLPEDQLTSTTLSVDDAMRIVISGGVLTPDTIEENGQPPGGDSPEDGQGEEGAEGSASNQ